MRTTRLIATFALTGGLFAAGATLVLALAQNAPVPAPAQVAGMSMQALQDKLTAAGDRDFEKIERRTLKACGRTTAWSLGTGALLCGRPYSLSISS